MNEILDGVRVLLSLSFLFFASWSDWRRREVSNRVWLVMAPLAFVLTTFQFIISRHSFELLQFYLVSFALTAGLSVALFYVGAFGGADAKALMCLALALPSYPLDLYRYLFRRGSGPLVSPVFPISVFSNGVLLAALTVVYAALRNVVWRFRTGRRLFEGFERESFWRRFLTFFTGYKVRVSDLERGHMYPLEDIAVKESGESERRLLVFPRDEKVDGVVKRILKAKREGRLPDVVWATPGLPLLVFLTAGLVVALVFGDIVWIVLGFILA